MTIEEIALEYEAHNVELFKIDNSYLKLEIWDLKFEDKNVFFTVFTFFYRFLLFFVKILYF